MRQVRGGSEAGEGWLIEGQGEAGDGRAGMNEDVRDVLYKWEWEAGGAYCWVESEKEKK